MNSLVFKLALQREGNSRTFAPEKEMFKQRGLCRFILSEKSAFYVKQL